MNGCYHASHKSFCGESVDPHGKSVTPIHCTANRKIISGNDYVICSFITIPRDNIS
jgi:hypothetical protein